jgi:hypothetical protein
MIRGGRTLRTMSMFVQIIEGKVPDAGALRAAGEAWDADVRPVAKGFLGVTGGVAADGSAITVVRFADRAAAEANNELAEQQAWFAAHAGVYDGAPTFTESDDVDELLGGGSDDAGFVQVMQGTCADRQGASAFQAATADRLRAARPDLLGGITVWHDGDRFTDVNWFTSEADARTGEAKMGETMADDLAEFTRLFQVDRWIDLAPPDLFLG